MQVLTELGQISDPRVIDAKISELQEELNSVWDVLMGYELQLAEQLEVQWYSANLCGTKLGLRMVQYTGDWFSTYALIPAGS